MSSLVKKAAQTLPVRIAVFVSGGGTNLQALINAAENKAAQFTIVTVIADRTSTGAEDRARRHGIPVELALPPKGLPRSEARRAVSDQALAFCRKHNAEGLVLAGFLTIMNGGIINEYSGKIINVHPALLPDFGGPGMWGNHVHEAVLASGAQESGCTIHLVDTGCDTGPILLQRTVRVEIGDTPETLANRIHVEEHVAIVEGSNLLAHRIRKGTIKAL